MKKTHLALLTSGLLLLGLLGNALATTFDYEDVYMPGENYLLIKNDPIYGSKTWNFDITDDSDWNNPVGQIFNAGTIVLVLDDNGDNSADKGTFKFEITGTAMDNQFISDYNGFEFQVSASAFDDGKVSAILTATVGDFYFRRATLNVTSEYLPTIKIQEEPPKGPPGTSGPTPVPEPSTMVLLGSGLLGLIYVGRSRRRK